MPVQRSQRLSNRSGLRQVTGAVPHNTSMQQFDYSTCAQVVSIVTLGSANGTGGYVLRSDLDQHTMKQVMPPELHLDCKT